MEKQVIPLGKTGKEVVLYRDGEVSRAMVTVDGRELSLGLRAGGCSAEQRLAAEKRLVRAGAKTLMFWETLGTTDPKQFPARIAERYPDPLLHLEACDKWQKEHAWTM